MMKTHSKETKAKLHNTGAITGANCEVIHVDQHVLVVNLCVNKQIMNFIFKD